VEEREELMGFQPSEHSYGDYGWSSNFPAEDLTVSGTARARGLSNEPATSAHRKNLSRLSDFLARLPFELKVTSAYRSPAVNLAVKGSKTSQHPNGLAVDAVPRGVSNKDVASWLHTRREEFPELDQVIWYTDSSHVHIGICPPGASACRPRAPRGEFYRAKKEGSQLIVWGPTSEETARMLAIVARNRPGKSIAVIWGVSLVVTAGLLGVVVLIDRRRKRGLE
jgi:zinc D-Ala-D-Ala carboxypeptidase